MKKNKNYYQRKQQFPNTEFLLDVALIIAAIIAVACAFIWVGGLWARKEVIQIYRQVRYWLEHKRVTDDMDIIPFHNEISPVNQAI